MVNKTIFNQINKTLNEYFIKSESMLLKGFPWIVVLSFHEVYRHLYPIEPYIENYSIPDTKKPQYLLDLLYNQ